MNYNITPIVTLTTREELILEKILLILNISSFLLFPWIFFYPRPYTLSRTICLLFPITGLVLLFIFRAYIQFETKEEPFRSSIVGMYMIPSMVLALRSLLDFDVLHLKSIWIPIGIVCVLISLYLFFVTDEFRQRIIYFVTLVIPFTFVFSYGFVMQVNCLYDYSEPVIYKTMIIEKKIVQTKRTWYEIRIKSWREKIKNKKITVSKKFYASVEKGGYITINEKKGLFGIRWFYPTQ